MSDKNAKILLVEDDTSLSAVYRARLEVEGFEVREVNNGEDALAAAIEFRPNLIVLDAMMPKIDGFDVLDILRNTSETTNIRIIMLTALSQPKDKERAKDLGADDYLVKSQVVIGDVVERIKYHLNGGAHVQDDSAQVNDEPEEADGSDDSSSDESQDDDSREDQPSLEDDTAHDGAGYASLDEATEGEDHVGVDDDGANDSTDFKPGTSDDADEDMLEAALNELENTEVDEDSSSN